MKKFKFIQTLINIWSIEELRNKILFTLMMIAIYRVGAHIVLPGIDASQLKTGANNSGILGLLINVIFSFFIIQFFVRRH